MQTGEYWYSNQTSFISSLDMVKHQLHFPLGEDNQFQLNRIHEGLRPACDVLRNNAY
jgi:hypothetical protein